LRLLGVSVSPNDENAEDHADGEIVRHENSPGAAGYDDKDTMDVIAQALNVAEQAEASTGSATLTFDLRDPSQRAAYAAALAVLRISGVDEDALFVGDDGVERKPKRRKASRTKALPRQSKADSSNEVDGLDDVPDDAYSAELRKRYSEAMTDLTPDAERRGRAARETFPRVVELLRDGANVDSVAQIQYRRWVEDHLDAVR
jgi:hypothetical protein